MNRPLSALVLVVAFMSGCSNGDGVRQGVNRVCGPDVAGAPCGEGAQEGVTYRFQLLTHCGIEWAYLDGRYWIPKPKIDPPSDWAAITKGTMRLVDGDEAVFEGDPGGKARFAPALASYRPQPCA